MREITFKILAVLAWIGMAMVVPFLSGWHATGVATKIWNKGKKK